MAMFGFVYLWYLMVVLVLEIWFDYRKDLVPGETRSTGWRGCSTARSRSGPMTSVHGRSRSTIGSAASITIIGIPSAFLLHGYVGFIFGSIKANPWWSTPLMPIVFLFSAIVSGIARSCCSTSWPRGCGGSRIDLRCVDTIAQYLFYAL